MARVGFEKVNIQLIILNISRLYFLNVQFYILENTGKEDENIVQGSPLRLTNIAHCTTHGSTQCVKC